MAQQFNWLNAALPHNDKDAMCRVYEEPIDDFINLVANSENYSQILKSLGLSIYGGNSNRKLKQRILELDLCTKHFTSRHKPPTNKREFEEILVENSTYTTTVKLKKRLIIAGMLIESCALCGIGVRWNDMPLVLQLDHINGIHSDNRLTNLRLLCPNCHSQTDTYAGKNRTSHTCVSNK